MSSQYGELRPTNGWDRLVSLQHPSKFLQVSRLCFITALTSLNGGQPNFAWCLSVSWAGTLYIHFWGLLPPNGILPCAKFTLLRSLAFSCIGSITARHSSSVHQPNFVAWYNRLCHLYSEGGHHVGRRPTFYFISVLYCHNFCCWLNSFIDRVKWRHISMVTIRSPFCRSTPSYYA